VVYKKYIYKKGKKFGPYYFKSVRNSNGGVKSIYLGKRHPNYKLGIFALAFAALFLISFLGYFSYNAFIVADVSEGEVLKELELPEEKVEEFERIVDVGEIEEEIEEEINDAVGEEILENETLEEINETEEIIKPTEFNLTELDNETINITGVNESEILVNETEDMNISDNNIGVNETEEIIKPNVSEINLTEIDNETVNSPEINETSLNVTGFDEIDFLVNDTVVNVLFGIQINEPVFWEKHISLKESVKSLTVKLPNNAENITFEKLEAIETKSVKLEEIRPAEFKSMGPITGEVVYGGDNFTFSKIINFFKDIFRFTGFVVFEEKELFIEGPVREVMVKYSLPGPISEEKEISPLIKQVIVSSDIDYEDVLVYTNLTNSGGGVRVSDSKGNNISFASFDKNEDGKVDYIEWVSPTSNETFNISITVLNVQSYPVVGGNWTVSFSTLGVADLKVTAINGTTWGESTSENDLALLEIKCGGEVLDYDWDNNSVIIANYSCDEIGNESSYVRTFGRHDLEFDFGGEKAYARNAAVCGETVSGYVTLEGDIVDCSTHGLTIGAHGTTIDCGGYMIDGDHTNNMNAINIGGYDRITVKDCYIKEFDRIHQTWGATSDNYFVNNTFHNFTDYFFLHWTGSHNNTFVNNSFSSSASNGILFSGADNLTFFGNNVSFANYGMEVRSSEGGNISNNIFYNLTTEGVNFRLGAHDSLIYNNTFYNLATRGIRMNAVENNTIDSNIVYNAATPIYVQTKSNGTAVTNNRVYNNSGGNNGMYFPTGGSWLNISNNTIYNIEASGIYLVGVYNSSIIGNNLTMNNLDGTYGGQLEGYAVSFNNFTGNYVYGGLYFAARIYNSFHNSTFRNNIFANSSNSLVYFEYDAKDNKFYDNYFEENMTSGSGVYLARADRTLFVNAHFVGDKNPTHTYGANFTTYINSSLDNMWNDGKYGKNFTVKWFVDLNVTDSSGNAIEDANVTIYDDSDALVFTELSNSTGYITRKNLTEYIYSNISSVPTWLYEGNYTINTTSPSDSYPNDTTLLNLSITNSAILNIVLEVLDTTEPTITWDDPTPSDGGVDSLTNVYLNTTVVDESNTSAFYDWNKSLIGYWSFEEVLVNGTVYDNSSYNNEGVMNNFGSNTTVSGKYGDALEFNDTYVQLPDMGLGGRSELTMCAWSYLNTLGVGGSDDGMVVAISGDSSYSMFWYDFDDAATGNDRGYSFTVGTSAGNDRVNTGDESATANQWEYICGVMNGSNRAIYLNGELMDTKSSGASTVPTPTPGNNRIGSWSPSAWYYFNGSIDEVKIFGRALSSEEVNASYNNSLYRLYNNFTGLDEGNYTYSAYAIDTSGNLNKTELRTFTVDLTKPTITWDDPTPSDGEVSSVTAVYLNATVADASNTSAFYDWNNSLKGYWSFENILSNGTVYDNSSYGNDGVMNNFASNSTVSGRYGNAVEAVGDTEWIQVSNGATLDGMSELTLETWFKTNFYGSDTLIKKTDCYGFLQTVSGGFRFDVENSTEDVVSTAGGTISDGNWHHLVGTYNGTATRIYIDGEIIDSQELSGNVRDTASQFSLLGSQYGDSGANGTFDEIKLYTRALSFEEINASYDNGLYRLNSNFTGLSSGTYNYSAYAIDVGGNLNKTESRFFTVDTVKPTITWEYPTPNDGDAVYNSSVYLNTTIVDGSNTSAFYDWNNSLIGYWSFEDVLWNGTVYDNSSYGNDGMMVNFAKSKGTNHTVEGYYGQAIEFDGIDDYVYLASEAIIANLAEYSIDLWVKFGALGGEIAVYDESIGAGTVSRIKKNASDHLEFSLLTGGTWYRTNNSDTVVLDTWYHVVATLSSAGMKLYIDGVEKGANPNTVPSDGAIVNSWIGRFGQAGHYLNGTVDEVRLYSRALSPEEINASYNNSLYRLYHNFTDLSGGTYNYSAYAIDTEGNLNKTGLRNVTVNSAPSQVARVDPTPTTYTNYTLHGYCNGTDVNSDDLAYYWKWYLNDTLFAEDVTNDITEDDTEDDFYCDNTLYGFTSPNAVDEDWNIGVEYMYLSSDFDLYMNYSMPSNVLNASAYIKIGGGNCDAKSVFYCYNGTDWQNITYWFLSSPRASTHYRSYTIHDTCLNNGDSILQEKYHIDCSDDVFGSTTFYEEQVYWKIGPDYSYSSGVEVELSNISEDDTTKGENWTFSCLANDGYLNASEWDNDSVEIINALPGQTILDEPGNDTTTNDRPLAFYWNDASDVDEDELTYHFMLDDDVEFGGLISNVTEISDTSYLPEVELDTDVMYFWKVRAYDGTGWGSWSDIWDVTIDSLLDIVLTNAMVDFSSLGPESLANTTDPAYDPFALRNDGNIMSNVSINATELFDSVALNTDYYRFKADNMSGEEYAVNWTVSVWNWTNMSDVSTFIIESLNYSDSQDSVEVDILVNIPGFEPPGNKLSNVTFEVSIAEQ
jgi:hypothetical protein